MNCLVGFIKVVLTGLSYIRRDICLRRYSTLGYDRIILEAEQYHQEDYILDKIDGIVIPVITPFDDNERLNLNMMEFNFNYWNKTDIKGYMCLGSNGEFRSLSDQESLIVIQAAAKLKGKDKCLIAGVGRESLYQTLKFVDKIQEQQLKIDYISVLTPNYFKKLMTDKSLIQYYLDIANYSSYPVLAYCAPDYANSVNISIETLKVIAKHPNIVGIKDTSKDMMTKYMDVVGHRDDFMVIAGSLNNIMECLEKGGSGGVISAANYFPEMCAKLINIFQEEGIVCAKKYYDTLKVIVQNTGAVGGIAGIKYCMDLIGLKGGNPRRPILPLEPELKTKVADALKGYDRMILAR